MPVSDGDYKKRLAASKLSKNKAPKGMVPLDTSEMIEFMPPVAGVAGAAGEFGAPLLGRIASPIIQRALQTAGMEGKQIGAGIMEDAAAMGVKYGQGSVARAGKQGEEALFDFIKRLEYMGVKPKTANRLLKGFSEYADDPAQAMMTLGENMARNPASGMSAKEALLKRMFDSIGKNVEDTFFGG